jgi:drug/metabolite transporter (DMT)-like permease
MARMKRRDAFELVLLAALWGASFLFMRMGAGEFGPLALSALRALGASLLLVPLLAWRGELPGLRRHWRSIALVGITNSALPFLCFSYAALSLSAGLSSIFNAATPLLGTMFAVLWLKDRLTAPRAVGLAIGFAGVLWLAWDHAHVAPAGGAAHPALAVAACIAATVLYGFSANFTKKYVSGAPPMALAAGSQLAAAIVLIGPALWAWPAAAPSPVAWTSAVLLALLCTGVAYILYFRLIRSAGPSQALTVTYLIPAFAVVWGAVFLGEALTPAMVGGCAVILLGTALATGLLKWPARRPASLLP